MRFYYSLETRHGSNLLSSRIIFWTPDRCINFFCSLLSPSLSLSPPAALDKFCFCCFTRRPRTILQFRFVTMPLPLFYISIARACDSAHIWLLNTLDSPSQMINICIQVDSVAVSSWFSPFTLILTNVFFFLLRRERQTDWRGKIRSIYPQRIDSGLIIWRREWRHSWNRKHSHTIWHWTVNTELLLAYNKLYFVAEISPFTILYFLFYLFITWQLLRFGLSISSLNMWFFNF